MKQTTITDMGVTGLDLRAELDRVVARERSNATNVTALNDIATVACMLTH